MKDRGYSIASLQEKYVKFQKQADEVLIQNKNAKHIFHTAMPLKFANIFSFAIKMRDTYVRFVIHV